jgi:predicted enzyme related to lactoylglutathione lyase
MKINSVAFFAYPVSDITKARAFYEGLLGLAVTHDFSGRWIEYDIGETTLVVTNMADMLQPGAKGGWAALEVDDLDAWMTKLKAAQVPVRADIFETPVCRMAVVADPDGNGICLHQRKPAAT